MFYTPQEVLEEIADKFRKRRKVLRLTQQMIADRSGVSYGSIKRFERTGKISLESLLQLALVVDSLPDFGELFKAPDELPGSLDDIIGK